MCKISFWQAKLWCPEGKTLNKRLAESIEDTLSDSYRIFWHTTGMSEPHIDFFGGLYRPFWDNLITVRIGVIPIHTPFY